jgi:hypothetical protein
VNFDPLQALRGEVGYTDPLTRARLHGQQAEQAEWDARELERAQSADRREAQLAQRDATERLEIARDGHSRRELDEWKRAQEAQRLDRVAELVAELARIDPNWRQLGGHGPAGTGPLSVEAGYDPGARRAVEAGRALVEELSRAKRARDRRAEAAWHEARLGEISRSGSWQ